MAEKTPAKSKNKDKAEESGDEDVIMSIRMNRKIKSYLQDLKEDDMFANEVDEIRHLIVEKWRSVFGKGNDEIAPLVILLKQLPAKAQAELVAKWLADAKKGK
nr:hypothetical protein [Candidatus Sigynarchaeum springense]